MLALAGLGLILLGAAPLAWAVRQSPQRLSPVHLVPASAGLFFGLPPIVYLAITGRGMAEVLPAAREPTRSALASIAVFVLVCAAASVLLGRQRKVPRNVSVVFPTLAKIGMGRIVPAALLVWAVRAYLAFRYGDFYAGAYVAKPLPYLLTIITHLSGLLATGIVLWSAWTLAAKVTRSRRVLAAALLILEGVYVFAQGRREMFFIAVLVAVVWLYATPSVSWKYALFAAAGAAVLALVAFPVYQATRDTLWSLHNGRDTRLGVTTYYHSVLVASQRNDAAQLYLSNLEERLSAYYRWQTELASLRDQGGGLQGRLALSGLTYAIPRLLFERKFEIQWGEGAVSQAYGIPVRDAPNSVAAAGFADFGITGAALYGFLLVLLVSALSRAGTFVARWSPFLGIAFIGTVMLLALRTEISMVGVFSSVRDLVVLGLAATVLSVIVRSYRRRVFGKTRH